MANEDFHLDPSDIVAKNAGADLSGDANLPITTDIDGQLRPAPAGAWDIGADESATAVYYSVGQNTNDHKTGTPTLTISGGIGTFSEAQTATNLGVGDKVTYNTSSVAYISAKISQTQWKLITATGGTPADVTGQTVNSIAHAFNSLSAAEAGAPALLGTSDLMAGNYQLNFPCYYDSGADTTAVTVNGYITGVGNYIKIYTPNNISTEVNLSQRHLGKWDDGKYNMSVTNNYPLWIYSEYVKVDGLQIKLTSSMGVAHAGIYSNPGKAANEIVISNNILRASLSSGVNNIKAIGTLSASNMKIFDNVIHDFIFAGTSVQSIIISQPGNYYIYNNTVNNSNVGFQRTNGTAFLKNNIAQNCLDYGFIGTFDASSTNNISQDATSPNVALRNKTATFIDATNKNFHLASTDTAAKGTGVNLQNDSPPAGGLHFSQDIDGQERSGNWDIGADQFDSGSVNSPEVQSDNVSNGLVGHWTFDGQDTDWSASSGQIKDSSGSGNNGTVSGLTKSSVADGKLGQGINFIPATNPVINEGSDVSLDDIELQGGGGMTISAWIKPLGQGQNNYNSIVSKGDVTNANSWAFLSRNNYIAFRRDFDGATDLYSVSTEKIQFGIWQHVVMTWDGGNLISNVHMYVNGVDAGHLLGSSADGQGAKSSDGVRELLIGNGQYTGRALNGSMDDLRIYKRMLSANEITALYKSGQATVQKNITKIANGLVGYWSFDGPTISGTTVTDQSGLGNNGTISGATVADGKVGQGMGFDGVNDRVVVGTSNSLNFYNNDYTIAAWINLKSNNASFSDDIIARTNGTCGFDMGIRGQLNLPTGRVFIKHHGATEPDGDYGNTPVTLNEWNYVAVSYDNTSHLATFYVNGNSDGQKTVSAMVGGAGCDLRTAYIGIDGRDALGFVPNGAYDEIRAYNRVLTAQEISNLYQTGKVKIKK